MNQYEVPEPIINSPFDESPQHWYIRQGEAPELRSGRRVAIVYRPREYSEGWDLRRRSGIPARHSRPTAFVTRQLLPLLARPLPVKEDH